MSFEKIKQQNSDILFCRLQGCSYKSTAEHVGVGRSCVVHRLNKIWVANPDLRHLFKRPRTLYDHDRNPKVWKYKEAYYFKPHEFAGYR